MTIPTSFEQVTTNSPDGAQVGKGTGEKIAFFGSTPVAQPASANQAVVAATAVATAALTAIVPAITYSANTPTPSDTQTISDGTVPTVAELGQFTADQEDFNLQVKVDLAAQKAEVDKLVTDVAALIVLLNQERSDLITLGLSKGAA